MQILEFAGEFLDLASIAKRSEKGEMQDDGNPDDEDEGTTDDQSDGEDVRKNGQVHTRLFYHACAYLREEQTCILSSN